ncbi:MAG: PepSY-associated TM helix domain-containing protein [Planctomycetota bacterium]
MWPNEPLHLKDNEQSIVNYLKSKHKLRGKVAEFIVETEEVVVILKGPAYAADIYVNRKSGKYTISESKSNLVGLVNDLHKGRDSGSAWSLLIDVSAIALIAISLSGFGLLFYIRKERIAGLVVSLIGTLAMLAVWWLWVP